MLNIFKVAVLASDAASRLIEKLGGSDFLVPGIQVVSSAPKSTELRFFHKNEETEASEIVSKLKESGLDAKLTYISGYEDSKKIRSRHYELWFSAP